MVNKKNTLLKDLLTCCIWSVILFLIISLFFNIGRVVSGSMEPTLQIGDVLFSVNKRWDQIDFQDIVIFRPDKSVDEGLYVKRVIGLPGDCIEFKDGRLIRNGVVVKEPYVKEDFDYSGYFVVPNNSYFVLGDNRNNSFDSRFWDNPFVGIDNMKYILKLKLFNLF